MNKFLLATRVLMAPGEEDDVGGDVVEDSRTPEEQAFDFLSNEGKETDEPAEDEVVTDETEGEAEVTTEDEVGEEGSEDEVSEGEGEEETVEGEEEAVKEEEPLAPDEEAQAEEYRGFRENLEKDFAISEEDAMLLVTEPESVMPKLAANLYERVVTDVMRAVQNQVPQLVTGMRTAEAQTTELRSKFYSINPGLESADVAAVESMIPQYADLIRKQTPNLTQDELIRKVGTVIGAALGVDAGKKKVIAPSPQGKPKPAAPIAPAPARAVSPLGGAALESGQSDDFLTELIQSHIEE